jgi:hypothetical protein
MTPTKEQRAMMAAHVGDLALRALRRGEDGVSLLEYARDILTEDDPEDFYREALLEADYGHSAVEASFAAIADGRHPATSLPGMVEEMRNEALDKNTAYGDGEASACADVLDLLGCPVTP